MQRHCDSLTECCQEAGSAAATASALLTIKSTMLNHDHGAAFILGTYDCLYYYVLSGVKL